MNVKISAQDVTKWIVAHKMKKQPADLSDKELDEAAKDLKIDRKQLLKLIAASNFDTELPKPAAQQNKLHGEINSNAVVHYQRGIYDTD